MSNPLLTILPLELVDKILLYLTRQELKTVNRVNRVLWRRASAQLWSTLFSFNPLFRLITGKSLLPGRKARPEAWERKALINRLPKNLKGATWQRFEEYRDFVRVLYVGRCVLPPSLYACLWEKRNKQALLPQLHTLFVSPMENQEWQWNPCANDVEDMLLLFLNSSVRRFASSCDQHAIVPSKILDSAPNLEEMRLGASGLMIKRTECAPARKLAGYDWRTDPDNKGVYVQQDISDWPIAMVNLFPRWKNLSRLTVNGYFICTLEVLESIARIPALTQLGIYQPDTDFWGNLGCDPVFFAFLAELSLWRTTPECAMQVFRCTSLLKGIERLRLDITRVFHSSPTKASEDAALCLEALREVIPLAASLAQIHISDILTVSRDQLVNNSRAVYVPIWSRIESVDLLTPLKLCRLHIDADFHLLEYDATPMRALLSLGPQLTYLSMPGVMVPSQAFTIVADFYPLLGYLRCQMDMAYIDADFLKKAVSSLGCNRFLDNCQTNLSHTITLDLAMAAELPPAIRQMTNRTDLDSPHRAIQQLTLAWPARSIILNCDPGVEQSKHALRNMSKMGNMLKDITGKGCTCGHRTGVELEGSRVEAEVVVATDDDMNMEREVALVDDDDVIMEREIVLVDDDDVIMEWGIVVVDD